MEEQKSNKAKTMDRNHILFALYCMAAIFAIIFGMYVIEYLVNQRLIVIIFLKLSLFYIVVAPYLAYRKKDMDFEVQQRKFYYPLTISFTVIIVALFAMIRIFSPLKYWSIPILTFYLFFPLIKHLAIKYGVKGKTQSKIIVWSLFLILIASSIGIKANSADLHTSWQTFLGEETIATEIENIRNWNKATLGTWDVAENDDIAIVALQPKYAIFADEDTYIWLVIPHENTYGVTKYKLIPYGALEYYSERADTCVMKYYNDWGREIQVKHCAGIYYVQGTLITVYMHDFYDSGVIDEFGNKYVSLFNEKNKLLVAAYWYDEGEKVPDTLIIGSGENKIKVSVQHGR